MAGPVKAKSVSVKKQPPTDLELKIADYINKYLCSVPGCLPSIHVEDARSILQLVEAKK